jgi:hypothetical protein
MWYIHFMKKNFLVKRKRFERYVYEIHDRRTWNDMKYRGNKVKFKEVIKMLLEEKKAVYDMGWDVFWIQYKGSFVYPVQGTILQDLIVELNLLGIGKDAFWPTTAGIIQTVRALGVRLRCENPYNQKLKDTHVPWLTPGSSMILDK